jgi:hypothetical protein
MREYEQGEKETIDALSFIKAKTLFEKEYSRRVNSVHGFGHNGTVYIIVGGNDEKI